MSDTVRIGEGKLLIDGRPVYLRSGEISYFRVPQDQWRDRLDKARGAGLNCTSTYVPWIWHEPEEGHFDLDGVTRPERNLRAYLDAIADAGLWAFVRPGPFINSEMIYGGYPSWVFENYPEVYSLNADGQKARWTGRGAPVASLMQPTHLELVRRWYEKVIPILAEYQIDNGGPIILTQPDNEFNMTFTYGLLDSGYETDVVGSPETGAQGRWQTWLLQRYGSVDKINDRFGLAAARPVDVQPPRCVPDDAKGRRLALDWLLFKQAHIFEYAAHLADQMRDLGLTIPWSLNEPVNMVWDAGDHAAASRHLASHKDRCFTTGHLYLTGGEQDILGVPITLYRIEHMKSSNFDGPAFASEMGAAWADLSRNRASYNWVLLAYLALGHGIDAYNVYMFAGGTNPPNTNVYGRDYDWQAPVGAGGELNEPYGMAARLGQFVEGWDQQILQTAKQPDVRIGIFSELPLLGRFCEQQRTLKAADGAYGRALVEPTANGEVYDNLKQLVTVLTALNVNFEFVNFTDPNVAPAMDSVPMIVPNSGELPSEALTYVERHLRNGGKALFYPAVPEKSLEGEPFPAVLEELGLAPDDVEILRTPMLEPGSSRWTVDSGTEQEVAVDGRMRVFRPPDQSQILASRGDKAVVFAKDCFEGRVVVAGMLPTYLTLAGQRLYEDVLSNGLGLRRFARSENNKLHVVGRQSSTGDTVLVTVANVLGRSGGTRLVIGRDHALVFPTLTELEVKPKSVWALWVRLDLGGLRLEYCTSELVPKSDDLRSFTLQGDVGTTGEIAFDRGVHVFVSGKPVPLRRVGERWVGVYAHTQQHHHLQIQDDVS